MATALIGYTGFVGGNLIKQNGFSDLYNSKDIEEIRNREFELVVCAGAPAVKWQANREPEPDKKNLERLMDNLAKVKTQRLILISTIDVYPQPVKAVDEETPIDLNLLQPYGKHRRELELFVIKQFPHTTIVRLPGLFGDGLKKNFIYDLIHDNVLHLTHKDSRFQFYSLANLWSDLQIVLKQDLKVINFATEPVSASEVAKFSLNMDFANVTETPPADYDMRTKYASVFESSGRYLYMKDEILSELKNFILKEKQKLS